MAVVHRIAVVEAASVSTAMVEVDAGDPSLVRHVTMSVDDTSCAEPCIELELDIALVLRMAVVGQFNCGSPTGQFVVRKWAIRGGYYVSVLKRGEQVDTITGFAKEHEAVDWIKEGPPGGC